MANTDGTFASYEEWRDAIANRGKIRLTRDYCAERVRALQDPDDTSTKRFIDLFGLAYRDKVVSWFKRAGGDR